MNTQFMLPSKVRLKADTISYNNGWLCIHVTTCQSCSICPLCSKVSQRVHSKYLRRLADLPVSGNRVSILLLARRYYCVNIECPRKIFTERFQCEIKPYLRRLVRSNTLLARMALELGGNMGSTISEYVGIPVSASTVLRILKKLEIPGNAQTSGKIGIDDWAFKKGNTYGTIIVDLESRETIDLLPDREADTLEKWLKNHPEIVVISRDRYSNYALGAKNGAPEAVQVADRFHLIRNLGDTTKKVFQSKGKELKEVFSIYNDPDKAKPLHAELKPSSGMLENAPVTTLNVSANRLYKFEKIKELYKLGRSIKSIAKTLKVHRETVRKYIRQDTYQRRISFRTTNFDVYVEFLLQDSNTSKTRKELFQIIKKMGFNGKYTQFCFNLNALWEKNPEWKPQCKIQDNPIHTWSSTRLSMMLYMDENELSSKDKTFMTLLYNKLPAIKEMGNLVKRFKDLFVKKEDGTLKKWIHEASMPGSLLKRFAKNLLSDFEAVNNAVITEYSNGQVEGQVNRLKNIKRRMYGKASFQLLRKMVLVKSV